MFMFLFKKIVSRFFFPLPFCLILSFTGLYLLWFSKKQTLGKLLMTGGVCLLALLSFDPLAVRLPAPFEQSYPAFSPHDATDPGRSTDAVRFIVVLGGGHRPDPNIPITSQLNPDSLIRLVEAIRLQRLYPQSKLVLSGGAAFDTAPESSSLMRLALELGVNRNDLIPEPESLDTKDQARIVKSIVGNDTFILVTSASHMPRSMALFKKQGMDPIPAPTAHLVRNNPRPMPSDYFPNARSLHKSETAVYEFLGTLWGKLRRLI